MDTSILKKKVAGVPVIYPAVAFVGVLVFFAWRMKGADAEPDGDLPTDETGDEIAGDTDYSKLASNGTVTVVQGQDPATVTPVVVETNLTWMNKGVNYLGTQGVGAGVAQAALSAYLNGSSLTYEQGQYRDQVVKQYGLPPESITPGATAEAAAKRQGNPPTVHTIQGSNDNSYTALAKLYYGRTDGPTIDFLQVANIKLGHAGPWSKGTKVTIPAYTTPKYYTVPSAKYGGAATIASKNGISTVQLAELNDSMKFPVKAGTKVRVH